MRLSALAALSRDREQEDRLYREFSKEVHALECN
jgi:hypothetical protein